MTIISACRTHIEFFSHFIRHLQVFGIHLSEYQIINRLQIPLADTLQIKYLQAYKFHCHQEEDRPHCRTRLSLQLSS